MQEDTQHSGQKIEAADGHHAKPGEPAIIRISGRSKQGGNVVDRLCQSGPGRFYRNHLKRIPLVRAVVIWTWRNFYPSYVKLLLIAEIGKWKRLVRFSDYIKDSGQLLLDTSVVEAPVPGVFPTDELHHLRAPSAHITFPKVQIAVVKNAIQYGGTNLVLVDERVICHDLYNFKLDSTSEELHGRTQIDAKAGRIRWLMLDEAPESIAEAASFVDACAGNYAHWMTEVLPRIALFCAEERFKAIPVVVNEGLHRNIMESLLMVAGARPILVLPVGRALEIDNLYLTSVTGYVPFDRRDDKLDGHSDGIFSPEALRRLGQCLAGKTSGGENRQWPEKIYLQRNSGTRKVVNQAALEQQLARHGYTTIDPEKLTFAQQVQIFSKARSIIGPTGAAFANAIFCQPGAQVTVLMGKHKNMIYRYWCNMLAPLGVGVNYILGDIVENRHLGIHGDFDVALADVAALLAEIEEVAS